MKTAKKERVDAIQDVDRAQRAEELINNTLYIEAVTAMNSAMFMQFQDTKFVDADLRHELWQRMQLMKQFTGKFESIIKQGVHAKKTLTLLDKAKEKFSNII